MSTIRPPGDPADVQPTVALAPEPKRPDPKRVYGEAAVRATRALMKAEAWFKAQGYTVRATYWWPPDAPRWGVRWDPHEGHFMFADAGEGPPEPDERPSWLPVLGLVADPAHPKLDDPRPLFATVTFVPELAELALQARDHAVIQLNQGAGVVEAWLSDVASVRDREIR